MHALCVRAVATLIRRVADLHGPRWFWHKLRRGFCGISSDCRSKVTELSHGSGRHAGCGSFEPPARGSANPHRLILRLDLCVEAEPDELLADPSGRSTVDHHRRVALAALFQIDRQALLYGSLERERRRVLVDQLVTSAVQAGRHGIQERPPDAINGRGHLDPTGEGADAGRPNRGPSRLVVDRVRNRDSRQVVHEFCELLDRARGDCSLKPPLELLNIEPPLSAVNTQFLADPVAITIRCASMATVKLFSVGHRWVLIMRHELCECADP